MPAIPISRFSTARASVVPSRGRIQPFEGGSPREDR
jgi:hypothetical protein